MIDKETTPYHAAILDMSQKYGDQAGTSRGIGFYDGAIAILEFLSRQADSHLPIFIDGFRNERAIINERRNNK